MSLMDMHISIFIDVLMTCTFMLMQIVSLPDFLYGGFRITSLVCIGIGPGLYNMHRIYW